MFIFWGKWSFLSKQLIKFQINKSLMFLYNFKENAHRIETGYQTDILQKITLQLPVINCQFWLMTCLSRENSTKSNRNNVSVNVFFEKNDTCTLIEELFWHVRLSFLEILSPCMVIKDCTFIRDIRVVISDLSVIFSDRSWWWIWLNSWLVSILGKNQNCSVDSQKLLVFKA